MNEIGRPQVGDSVVVSTAAGAVDSMAGQLARLTGCRTVGIAGGPEKVRLCVEEFVYAAAVDYRSPNVRGRPRGGLPGRRRRLLRQHLGAISDTVPRLINRRARIVACGTASVVSWGRGRSDPWSAATWS